MMTTATSPRFQQAATHVARSSTTPAARPSHIPGSVGQSMPPLLSPSHTVQAQQDSFKVRTPSPNYFGFQSTDSYGSDASQPARHNWSPPSSSVRSAAASSPAVLPVEQNPDFTAFRRQSDGKGFSLGNLHNFKTSAPSRPRAATRPSQGRTVTRQAGEGPQAASESRAMLPPRPPPNHETLGPESADLIRSPKRQLSDDSSFLGSPIRRASPASYTDNTPKAVNNDPSPADRHLRTSLPAQRKPPSFVMPKHRAETLPESTEGDASVLITPQHLVNLLDSATEEILVLDLRVSTQCARSRLAGALNLCIPTTLLKRPSFNVQKLAETFKDHIQRDRFESWRSSKYIVVYDASASQLKDAAICINTIKKFESEGYNGTMYILKGGFADFAKKFPKYINMFSEPSPVDTPMRLSLDTQNPNVPPVIGGCPMPANAKDAPANPFFGNIRQNMDLIGGVGQMPLKFPSTMDQDAREDLPNWLRVASEVENNGARVSDKFLHIEKREQRRMQEALSGTVSYGTPTVEKAKAIQIAGIEKGSKNRYNNIWPFEHSRVKLQNVPNHECDYVNANYIKSSLSNKRYIATQGPIPATFADFWNVIWQQDVRVIVMLTAEQEGGQIKAHDYWGGTRYGAYKLEHLSEHRASLDPAKISRHRQRNSAGSQKSFDTPPPLARLETGLATSSDLPYVIVRKLALSHDDFPFERMREITQLQYSHWPDFGAPAHPAHLLGLVEQCNAVVRSTTASKHAEPDPPTSRPVLVHCSAGCGRTGTFCTVDTVIDMLKRQRLTRRTRQGTPMDLDAEKKPDDSPFFTSSSSSLLTAGPNEQDQTEGAWVARDDLDLIERTVEDFRHQRLSMVQSLRQFVLCYESIMEWISQQEN